MPSILTNFKIGLSRRVKSVRRYFPSPYQIASVFRTADGDFCISSRDVYMAGVLRQGRTWVEGEVRDILRVVTPNSRVLCVGTHIGTLAIPISRYVAHVDAIEANPETLRYLRANLELNAVSNVTVYPFAAGEKAGSIEFLQSSANTGGAKRAPIEYDQRYYYDQPTIITIPLARLDDSVKENADVIVMDIEGSECFALRGMPRLLDKANHLFIEFLPHHLRNVSGIDADDFCDLILPYFKTAMIGGKLLTGQDIRVQLRAMFDDDIGIDLVHFWRD